MTQNLPRARRATLSAAAAALLLSWTVPATASPAPGPWSGRIAAGLVATSGNTEGRSQNLEFAVNYLVPDGAWAWKSGGKLLQVRNQVESTDAITGQTTRRSQTTAENYQLTLRAERNLDKHNFLFGDAGFYKDLFAATRVSTTQTVGYGRRVLATERRTLDLELGAGARQQELQRSAERTDEVIGQLALRFDSALGESSRFAQSVQVEQGRENTVTQATSRLKLSIFGALWAQLGFDLRYTRVTENGRDPTDTTTSLSLLWEFSGVS